jgi:hypothetical protein
VAISAAAAGRSDTGNTGRQDTASLMTSQAAAWHEPAAHRCAVAAGSC